MTTKLAELRKLAEAAAPDHNENPAWYSIDQLITGDGVGYIKNARFIAKANPQTILAMCDLLDVQHETILRYQAMTLDMPIPATHSRAEAALAAFDKFNGGE